MSQTHRADRLVRWGQLALAIDTYSRIVAELGGCPPESVDAAVQPVSALSQEQLRARVEFLRAQIFSRVWQQFRVAAVQTFEPTWWSGWRLKCVMVLLAGVLAAAYAARPRNVSAEAHWAWVNHKTGNVTRGAIPRYGLFRRPEKYFVHTDCDAQPALDIDLRATFQVQGVLVANRTDCCQERARTIQVLTSEDGVRFDLAAKHDPNQSFQEWTATFAARPARHIRLQLLENTCLHLSDVRVFGK